MSILTDWHNQAVKSPPRSLPTSSSTTQIVFSHSLDPLRTSRGEVTYLMATLRTIEE
jgi:hypothetical protein